MAKKRDEVDEAVKSAALEFVEDMKADLREDESVTISTGDHSVTITADGVQPEAETAEEVPEEAAEPEPLPEEKDTLVLAVGPGTRVVNADDGALVGNVKSGSWKAGVLQLTIEFEGLGAYRKWVSGLVCGPEPRPIPAPKPDPQMVLPETDPDVLARAELERPATNQVADHPEAARAYDEAVAQAQE